MVALYQPNEILRSQIGYKPVLGCEPNSYQPVDWDLFSNCKSSRIFSIICNNASGFENSLTALKNYRRVELKEEETKIRSDNDRALTDLKKRLERELESDKLELLEVLCQ